MLKISRKVEYAVLALLDMDKRGPSGLATARDISERAGVPFKLLARLLHRLGRAGLVKSSKGAKGGFRLMQPLSRVSLAKVIEAIEGPMQLVRCQCPSSGANRGNTRYDCRKRSNCELLPSLQKVQGDLMRTLQSTRLSSFKARTGRGKER